MTKKTKTEKPKDAEESQPRKVHLPDGTGPRWRKRRENLKLTTRELADLITKAGTKTTDSTVSNVETEKQRSLPRKLYAVWVSIIYGPEGVVPGDDFIQLVDELQGANPEKMAEALDVVRAVMKPRKQE